MHTSFIIESVDVFVAESSISFTKLRSLSIYRETSINVLLESVSAMYKCRTYPNANIGDLCYSCIEMMDFFCDFFLHIIYMLQQTSFFNFQFSDGIPYSISTNSFILFISASVKGNNGSISSF